MTGKKPLIIEVSTEKEWLTLLTVQVRRNPKLLCENHSYLFSKLCSNMERKRSENGFLQRET